MSSVGQDAELMGNLKSVKGKFGMAFGKFSQNNFVLAASLMKKAKLPGEGYHDRSLDY